MPIEQTNSQNELAKLGLYCFSLGITQKVDIILKNIL